MRTPLRTVACAIVIALGTAASPGAQVVSRSESALRPFSGPGEKTPANRVDPAPFTDFYVTAALTAAGAIADSSGNTVQIAADGREQFPALRLTISVAPRLTADDSVRPRPGLSRLNVHVRVRPLDASGQPIVSGGVPAVETLALSPSERTTSTPSPSNAMSEVKEAIALLMPHLGKAGAAVAAFEGAFHRAPVATQVVYQSGPDEFGWRWLRAPGAEIDGLHYTSALLQVPAGAASVQLLVELVSDWDRFGAWVKTYALVVSLK